jgi:hypothetical protein
MPMIRNEVTCFFLLRVYLFPIYDLCVSIHKPISGIKCVFEPKEDYTDPRGD